MAAECLSTGNLLGDVAFQAAGASALDHLMLDLECEFVVHESQSQRTQISLRLQHLHRIFHSSLILFELLDSCFDQVEVFADRLIHGYAL